MVFDLIEMLILVNEFPDRLAQRQGHINVAPLLSRRYKVTQAINERNGRKGRSDQDRRNVKDRARIHVHLVPLANHQASSPIPEALLYFPLIGLCGDPPISSVNLFLGSGGSGAGQVVQSFGYLPEGTVGEEIVGKAGVLTVEGVWEVAWWEANATAKIDGGEEVGGRQFRQSGVFFTE